MRCWVSIVFMVLVFAGASIPDAWALPRNFRNVDTFYVGGMPSERDMDEFKILGIKTIISLHRLPPEVQKRAERLGLELYSFPLRTRLINIEEIMRIMRESPNNTVYVHCLHGADRTGAVTAYWLSTERNYDPFTALMSVISPNELHWLGLKQLGNEYGICLHRASQALFARYSGARNGGLEGLKICGDRWYTKLARNYLSLTIGPPTYSKNERFWRKHNPNEDE